MFYEIKMAQILRTHCSTPSKAMLRIPQNFFLMNQVIAYLPTLTRLQLYTMHHISDTFVLYYAMESGYILMFPALIFILPTTYHIVHLAAPMQLGTTNRMTNDFLFTN